MITQICINAPAGQDCLEFSRIGEGPSKKWRFDRINSKTKTEASTESSPNSSINSVNQGLFYVNQSAYGHLI
ncbi:MAG: hypothetical protein HOB84_12405 [Candidatus Marinimicrobia bacterium]|jgi:hypothetical protein|nr:hypothetical protein [Candidatus Neomarinimicrobiota bacterium]MBT4361043.1 hypothetical protein [Candidatus Neomarinimicrobiota bacterium]MBT4715565.1 hypothetical protein [Candidatus Neomarinimicrobiota bacterium]MBT4946796.1 hypothetical protein [Candidatus Neomarinimicrobiota bacterium]MBT5269758.1 hypothetical protein [Candidatus Neomarinimicrobiota bacterium]